MPVAKYNDWCIATEQALDMLKSMSCDIDSTAWTRAWWKKLNFTPKYAFYRRFENHNCPIECEEFANGCSGDVLVITKAGEQLRIFLFAMEQDAAMFKLAWGEL